MKNRKVSRIALVVFIFLFLNSSIITRVKADDGPPTQGEAFNGHSFNENYWDIDVFNNSKWDHPEVDDMRSWLNNTWNVKWIKEGNFEMGMLAFLNKTAWEDGEEIKYVTPAQMW
ncbi:MAG: hypothetical protein KGD57_10060 [Candidatus Lokiarchaeota archaeon]|nr:hypothetical protein [Candidatus Lokiarchaeota archaeon]